MEFPSRIYTEDEVRIARELIEKGHRHRLSIKGTASFCQRVQRAIELAKAAGYDDFLRSYIRRIEEIDGLTQLRNADATIWLNKYAVENPVDAASVFIQKAHQMEEYLELRQYYGGEAEKRSVIKRIEFLQALKERSCSKEVITECERLLRFWHESSLGY